MNGFRLASFWLPSYSMVMAMVAVFDGFQRMRWSLLAEAGTFQAARLTVAVLVMLVAGWAWTGLVAAWAAAYAAAAILIAIELMIFLRRQGQPILWRGLPISGMIRDTASMFLPTGAPLLFSQAGVLVAWAGAGDAAAATFWVTWSLSLAVPLLCGPVGRVLFPAIANLRRAKDPGEMTRVLRRAFLGTSAVGLVFFAAVSAARGWLLPYLHQDQAGAILTVLLAAGFFEVVRVVFNPVLLACGWEKPLTVLEWASLGMILVGGFLATSAWGVAGLAGVFVAVYALSAGLRVLMLEKATGVRLRFEAAAMAAVVLLATALLLVLEWRGT